MAAGDLTDLATVKVWLGINDTTADALLGTLITAASTFVKSWLKRDVLSATYSERYMGNGRDTIVLANSPITAVSQVSWREQTLTTLGDPIAATPGFYFAGAQLSLWGYCFPYRGLVQVNYTAGYPSTPADIQQAVTELVGEEYNRRVRIGVVSKVLGGQETVSFSMKDMGEPIRAILNQYKAVAPVQTF